MRRMHVSAITSIDNGFMRHLAGILCSPFNVVSHHDDVRIIGHHHDSVFEGFSFRHTGGFGIRETNDACTEPVGCSFEAQTGASGRLEEKTCDDFSFESLAVGCFSNSCDSSMR